MKQFRPRVPGAPAWKRRLHRVLPDFDVHTVGHETNSLLTSRRLIVFMSAISGACSIHERDLGSTSGAGAGRPGTNYVTGGHSAASNNRNNLGGSEGGHTTGDGGTSHALAQEATGATVSQSSGSSHGPFSGGATTSLLTSPMGGVPYSQTAASHASLGGTIPAVTPTNHAAGTSSGGTSSGGTSSGGTSSGGTSSGGTSSGGTSSTIPAQRCQIAQLAVEDGRENPVNQCEYCVASSSSTSWTLRPNGWDCVAGFCQVGNCTPGCWIGATLVAPDGKQAGNACKSCQPSLLDTDWSNLPEGTNCASGKICHTGNCEAACFIDGAVVAAEVASSTRACGICAPGTEVTQWSRRSDCFRSLALGSLHSCARVDSGQVWCWGDNAKGQLGNNSLVGSSAPVRVIELLATSIAVGADHSCAVRSESGNVACWGSNQFGKLGANTVETYSVAPLTVLNVTGTRAVTAGYGHTCALLENRGIRCWGSNGYGQLGRGDNVDSPTAVAVSSIDNATAIAAGYSHTCALLDTGAVKCWGYNVSGQLGTSDRSHRNSPADVRDLSQVQAISAGYSHTCALLQGGTVKCWGSNASGDLGDGTQEAYRTTPVTVKGLDGVVEIAAGRSYTCARTNDGGVWCWGLNDVGQFGNGFTSASNPATSNVPVRTNALARAGALSAGEYHACAGLVDAGIQCWGDDSRGQLGNGPATDANLPVDVEGF